ncbi:MAG TPA: hypothetical protein PK624_09955 [Spirochaetota bacterium]|nr:hypothetical protein [Spirochaetota bacterium]HOR45107.1 hypothetical protein [Spirochaetota bacterium]HOU85917.1 hypothetical protein [Spirochaetota bacterium]HPK56573.1 hypothetical protein [Spirochaetota bacterium]
MIKKYLFLIVILELLLAFNGYSKEKKYLWIKAESGLNLRDSSSISSKSIVIIPFGSKVEYLSDSGVKDLIEGIGGKWIEVKWNEFTGHVFSGFTADNEDFKINYRVAVAVKGLPIMSADKEYYSNRKIPFGTVVEFVKNIDDSDVSISWAFDNCDLALIKYKGKFCKVNKNFLDTIGSNKHSSDIKKIKEKLIQSFKAYAMIGLDISHSFDSNDFSVYQLGNYYLITSYYYHGPGAEEVEGFYKYLFRENNGRFEYIDIYSTGRSSSKCILTDLNNDTFPDAIAFGGYSVVKYVKIYMGQKDGSIQLIYDYEVSGNEYDDLKELKITSSEVEIIYKGRKYHFDKSKGMIEK